MAVSYKARKRWSLVILVIGLPLYAILPALPKALEFIMYVVLGTVWIVPLKFVFQGIGQADPDADDDKN